MEILGKMTASDARRVSACAGHFTIERVPLATMRPTIVLTLLLLTLVTTQACSGGAPTQEALETAVVAALDALVAELVAERPADAAAYAERLRAYLEAHPPLRRGRSRSACIANLRLGHEGPQGGPERDYGPSR